jgi:stress-induced morphogen
MDTATVERLIEEGVPDAEAEVTVPRNPDDDAHFAAVVVSPAFEGESLVDRHQRVHDALEEYMPGEIHAIELTTHTPGEHEG